MNDHTYNTVTERKSRLRLVSSGIYIMIVVGIVSKETGAASVGNGNTIN